MSTLGDTELENLHNELKIMSIIDHPNIVRVYEYFECHDIVFIVMEYMSGGELFDRIVEYEHYTEKQAAADFSAIVDAVRYCHSLGIAHRDLKPENLLYQSQDENSVIKVSDFGLAKFFIPKAEEKLELSEGNLTETKKSNHKIIAVGTTSVRTLEKIMSKYGTYLEQFKNDNLLSISLQMF